jgi:DNA polymerase-3 subunit beta
MIRQVAFAAAPAGDPRPELTGVCLRLAGAELTLAATNRQRLALRGGRLDEPAGEGRQVVAPARALGDLAAVLDDPDAPVTIALAPRRAGVCFVAPTCLVAARLIAGDYPDYEACLPSTHATRIVVESRALALAVERADLFESGADPRVTLAVDAAPPGGDRRLVVTAQGRETGASASAVAADVTGAAVRIELNGRYLREALRALGAGPVALESEGATAPCLIRPACEDRALQLIMPYGPAR